MLCYIYTPVGTATEDEVRALMETLYFGPIRLIRAVLPHMRKRRYGVIVNVSSGAALDGRDSMGPYARAKAALDGISKVLANEVAPLGIRTLTVTLGTFNSNLARGKLQPNGDKDKAMKAFYEVVVGECVGKGCEA
ncbi:hypothetical protein F4814DRAFT_427928, partial [Daldinia grandis]